MTSSAKTAYLGGRGWLLVLAPLLVAVAPWTVAAAQAVGLPRTDDPAALSRFAREPGGVRVIVDLRDAPSGRPRAAASADPLSRARVAASVHAFLPTLPPSATVERTFDTVARVVVTVDAEALDRLLVDPRVASVRTDALNRPFLTESLTLVGGDAAHTVGIDGGGWAVAVLDTGVDVDHPFLTGAVVAEACFSTTSPTANASSACPDGSDEQLGPGAAAPPDAEGGDHGTHVAGIAVGRGDALRGTAPAADLIAVQVFSIFAPSTCRLSTPCLLAYDSDILAGLEFVLIQASQRSVASANLSLGGGGYAAGCGTEPIVAGLAQAGVAVVAASGNTSYADALSWPACLDGVVSVGAVGDGSSGWTEDVVASFSNASARLDLLAPGVSIVSSVPGGAFEALGGTSMAAPHVAGAWALAKQVGTPVVAAPDVATILATFQTYGTNVTDARNGLSFARLDVRFLADGTVPAADLRFTGPPTLQPAQPRAGEAVQVCTTWENAGLVAATARDDGPFVAIRGWLDDPTDPGARFTPDAVVTSLAVGPGDEICYDVTNAITAGAHVVHLALDPDDAVGELSDANNVATLSFTALNAPANDDAQDAIALTGASGSTTGSTVDATREADEPWHAGNAGGASVWWSWTAGVASVVTFSTKGSSFDTLLGLYDGASDASWTSLEANDDANADLSSAASTAVAAGDTVRVVVDGHGGAQGDVTLSWTSTPITCSTPAGRLSPFGDVDGDGVSTEADALQILRAARGSTPLPLAGTIEFHHADVDGDDAITEADASAILVAITDPTLPATVAAHASATTLSTGEVACLWVGTLGSTAVTDVAVTAHADLLVVSATDGPPGLAWSLARRSARTEEAWLTIDAGNAGRRTLIVRLP